MSAHKHPIIALFAITLLVSLPAWADGILHGRVSFESGGALVRGASDDDWSFITMNSLVLPSDQIWVDNEGLMEMEFSGGTFVRAADQSRLRVVEVPPQAVFEGTIGSFYVQRVSRSTGSVLFKTPAADIVIDQDTHARIDVLDDGATTVTVRWGEARVLSPAASPVTVREGRRVFIDPGLLPSAPVSFNRDEMDAFDSWSAERARNLATGGSSVPREVSVTPTTMGHRELSNHGTWVYVDNTPYWRPTTVVNYVPYRYGHWSHSSAYGYSWVGNYPFSYVTSHYGRWRHHPSHGWIWTYRETWAPAWVISVRYGSNYVWAPLDPWDRPVSYGSAHFRVGGHRISIHASSFAPVNTLFYGPVAVRPLTQTHITNINVTQVNIWNIYGSGTHYNRSPRYSRGHLDQFAGRDLPVRDFNPRRSIRGPEVDSRTNTAARTISSRLEQNTRMSSIEQGRSAPVRSIRTAQGGSRSAQVRQTNVSTDRSVRVTPDDSRVDRRALAEGRGSGSTARDAGRGSAATDTSGRTVRAPSAGERPALSRGTDTQTRERTTRGSSAGERPTVSRGTPSTGERSVDSRAITPDTRTRATAGDTRARGGQDAPRTREVTATPPNARGGRTIDSISTRPGARPDAADRTRGVRESTPSSVRQPAQTPSRQPAQTQVRQPSQVRSQQPQARTPERQPAQTQSRQPARTQPRQVQPSTPSRQAPAVQRETQQTGPRVRTLGPQRQSPSASTPRTTQPSRQQPAVRQPSAPSTRSVSPPSRSPQPSTQRSAPSQNTRSVSPPSSRSSQPSTQRSAPSQSTRSISPPSRSVQAPTQRSAPSTRSVSPPSRSPQPSTQRSAPSQSTRSISPPSRSVQAPTQRSAPSTRSVSPPSSRGSISAPSRSSGSSNRAVGGTNRGTSSRGR